MVARSLTIAGSDSGGGAGIQADLKTFTALGVYGTSALTAITAQNTLAVQGIHPMPAEFVAQQLESVLSDIGTDSAKTGMLFNTEIIQTVASAIRKHNIVNLVIDPVMISTSGSRLLAPDAIESLKKDLLPLAMILTPNIPEAELLASSSTPITSVADMRRVATELYAMGSKHVLIKGGHLPFDEQVGGAIDQSCTTAVKFVVDVFYDGADFHEFRREFIDTKNTHGTGCTLSSAIAAGLAKNMTVMAAVQTALEYVNRAISSSFSIGKGHGPLNHFFSPSYTSSTHSFVQYLKDSCPTQYHVYTRHPFVEQIANGTLSKASFQHFIRQDYIFLVHYARAYSLAGFKEHDSMEAITNAASIVMHIGEEMKLHIKFCESWGISHDELQETREAHATVAYTRYVLEKGLSGDRLDLRVALLPCLIGYGEIGMRLFHDPKTVRDGNPYWPWIQNYASDSFQDAVRQGCDYIESLAIELAGSESRRRKLCSVFRQATELEIQFWQMGLDQLD
ncbi:hypothetical protein SmJEL517_g01078 [Synchytrium microbalum]|uniref:Phosphomethylpyrimidine kinase n=1 Tax=Synchytrium microbalum TaxID=1806994 RepID=A0A507CDE0_9FUNG|nr:uncharacterized protein SmJEL517_g01078 [Synchytrium microbalum]TPX37189.1 hypothetical protein SmJEL517_g01078 [Synchytrium microbalum]